MDSDFTGGCILLGSRLYSDTRITLVAIEDSEPVNVGFKRLCIEKTFQEAFREESLRLRLHLPQQVGFGKGEVSRKSHARDDVARPGTNRQRYPLLIFFNFYLCAVVTF